MPFSLVVMLTLASFPAIGQAPAQPDSSLPLGLLIAHDPGGARAEKLSIRIDGDASFSSIPLYVKNTGKAELASLRFYAQLTDAAGAIVPLPAVTFQIKGVSSSDRGVTLPPGKEAYAILEVTQFNEVGTRTGWLLAEYAGTTTRLAALSLDRYPVPRIRLVGAAEGAGINLTSRSANFRHKFWIESINRGSVKSLQVLVAPLNGPDAVQVETTWTLGGQGASHAPAPLEELGALELEITAPLTVAGTYGGSITLIYAGRRDSTPLSITRTRPQPSVEIVGVNTVPATTFLSWNSPVLRFSLHETAGESLDLVPPALLSLTRKGRNQEKLQASYSGSSLVGPAAAAVPDPLTLPAGGTTSLELRLSSLGGAGEYTGTLRVNTADSLAIDQPFTILLKERWPTPLLLIAFGVAASLALRLWMTKIRPQLDREIRLQTLDEQLERLTAAPRGLDADELAVVSALRGRLDTLYQALAAGNDQSADDTLKDIEQKAGVFPVWVNARRRVAAIDATGVRVDLQHKLDRYGSYLKDTAHDDATFKSLTEFLASINSTIDGAVKADLLKRIGDLGTAMDHQRLGLKPENQLRLDEEVLPLKVEAQNEANAEHLADARLFDQARGRYATVLADDLLAGLDRAKPPLGFSPDDWHTLYDSIKVFVKRVKNAAPTDPDLAYTEYQSAYSLLLGTLGENLSHEIVEMKQSLPGKPWQGQPRVQEFADRLDALKLDLRSATIQAEARQFHEAAQAYNSVAQKFEALRKELQIATTPPAAAAPAGAADAHVAVAADTLGRPPLAGVIPGSLPAAVLPPVLAHARAARPTAAALTFQKRLFTWIFNGVILLLAVATGMQLLWLNNPTWGSGDDMLTAFMWGLGLHQVSGSALDLTGLAEKFSK